MFRHVRTLHPGDGVRDILDRMSDAFGRDTLVCSACGFEAHDARRLNIHRAQRHNKGGADAVVNCTVEGCGFASASRRNMYQHARAMHRGDNFKDIIDRMNADFGHETTTCPDCSYIAPSAKRLRLHCTRKHSKEADRVDCDADGCDYSTGSRKNLLLHLNVKHADDKRFDKRVERAKALFGPGKTKPRVRREFACPECDFKARKVDLMFRHRALQHRKGVGCDVDGCNFASLTRAGLIRHVGWKHKGKDLDEARAMVNAVFGARKKRRRPLECPKAGEGCTFNAQTRRDLQRHLDGRKHTPVKENPKKVLKISIRCPMCDFESVSDSMAELKAHVEATHKRIANFCEGCEFQFTTPEDLKYVNNLPILITNLTLFMCFFFFLQVTPLSEIVK